MNFTYAPTILAYSILGYVLQLSYVLKILALF